jgi:hypothetical protein
MPYDVQRTNWLTVHHTVAQRNSNAEFVNASLNVSDRYDFQVFGPGSSRGDGAVITGDKTYASTGAHARQCNCGSMGVGVQGCFGGSSPSDPAHCNSGNNYMSQGQELGIAIIWAGLRWNDNGTWRYWNVTDPKLRPHQYCIRTSGTSHALCPNESPAGAKACCGTRYCSPSASFANHYWNTGGLALRNRIKGKVHQLRGN